MAGKRPAHMVRVYDEGMFRRLRVRAAEEGRTVGAVVENALRLYLGAPEAPAAGYVRDAIRESTPSDPIFKQAWTAQPPASKVDVLRELVALVPSRAPQEPEGRTERARERAQRIADAQAYYREHPEEEGQG